ncbi:MAG: aminotransferase class V-fold PLP-dependent enzyme, partial [Terriglobia bacterium]
PEELAITRNTTESLMNAELGLNLKRGDEVITTEQDYARMIWAYQQRQRRDGVVLKMIPFPNPPRSLDDLVDLFERAITPRTQVVHFCHVTHYTGQIFPVKKICQMARSRGVPTIIVDGAHSFAQLPFKVSDFDCDYYGTSLHKWLCAPIGTGFLYVKKERLPRLWPLMAAPGGMDDNIRKLEQIGTNPAALKAGIAEALTFHEGIGVERKSARLRYLKDRWARRLAQNPRVKLLTSLDPEQSCGLATFTVEGLDSGKLVDFLWQKYGIIVVTMAAQGWVGVRVVPNVYTTVDEIDAFSSAVEGALRSGV